MGREAEAQISFQGKSGHGKLLLESTELLCRGEIRARIARSGISQFQVAGEDLILSTLQGPLIATLGARQAAAWVKALAKPAPTLGEKLGLGATSLAFVVGDVTDPALGSALRLFRARSRNEARLAVAEIREGADLTRALTMVGDLPLWAVVVKGGGSPFSDGQARTLLRASGYVDTKSCAVSAQMSATRWQKRAL